MPLANGPILAAASAPAKVILLGEHSVVFGRAAIAVPVRSLLARAVVRPSPSGLCIHSRIEGDARAAWTIEVGDEPASEPVAVAAQAALEWLGVKRLPAWRIDVTSTIPLARGLGSSAAVAVAVVRAVAKAGDHDLSAEVASALAYRAEQQAHGTPSGIDNTVIAWDRPIYFVRRQAQALALGAPVPLIVADSGERAPTHELVQAVRSRWLQDAATTEGEFDAIHVLVDSARAALAEGNMPLLGRLLTENHERLRDLGVSDRRLEAVVAAALEAGALGAKLSGAGGGGAVVALAPPSVAADVARAMIAAGASRAVQAVVE